MSDALTFDKMMVYWAVSGALIFTTRYLSVGPNLNKTRINVDAFTIFIVHNYGINDTVTISNLTIYKSKPYWSQEPVFRTTNCQKAMKKLQEFT